MTIRGNPWTSSSVMGVINNEKYTGDILLGKTFTVDPITKRRLDNLGEEDRFFIKNHHEPIISHETFEKAQALRERRNGGRQHHVEIGKREKYSRMFAFSSLIECGFCGVVISQEENGTAHPSIKRLFGSVLHLRRVAKSYVPIQKVFRNRS